MKAYLKLPHESWRRYPGYSAEDIATPLTHWIRSTLFADRGFETELGKLSGLDDTEWQARLRAVESRIAGVFAHPEPHEGSALARQAELRGLAEGWLLAEARARLPEAAKDWDRFADLLRQGSEVEGSRFPGWWPLFRAFMAEEVKKNERVQHILARQGIAQILELQADLKDALGGLQAGLEHAVQGMAGALERMREEARHGQRRDAGIRAATAGPKGAVSFNKA